MNDRPISASEPVSALALAHLLAHDLRTPLNAVRGFADLLLAGGAGPLTAEALDLLAEIGRAGRALEAAIALAQQLAEPAPADGEQDDLAALARACGFRVDAASCTALATLCPGPAGAGWRQLLAVCRDHLTMGGALPAPGGMTLRIERRAGLELLMERTDIEACWQMSALRERLIAKLAAVRGLAVVSPVPHLPLRLASTGAAFEDGSTVRTE